MYEQVEFGEQEDDISDSESNDNSNAGDDSSPVDNKLNENQQDFGSK